MEQSIESFIKNLVRETIVDLLPKIGRSKYVIANWKMNKTLAEAADFFTSIPANDAVSVIVCPPAQLLYPAHLLTQQQNKRIGLAGQNVHWQNSGAFTGEISAEMLKDVGCEYVIIGHSERRHYFHEDDEIINQKVKQSMNAGLIPIICIGETLEQKSALQTEQILSTQLYGALKNIGSTRFIIAYEPVWAIGTGQSATPEQAQETHDYIRSVLKQIMGQDSISILYGGSVNEKNSAEYSTMPDIDGVLVGGASLNAKSFEEIINVFAKGEQCK
ncbi:MAG TPA: triose-phosphate isomerase [Bacillales bacterium]|nr:triose-phosphate isomerase [Bacillales bacterium]